jgi:hypothetical protein
MIARSLFVSFFLVVFLSVPVQAAELETIVSTSFDAATIVKGYTLESSDGLMRVGIRPGTLNVSTRVDIKTLDPSLMENTYASFSDAPTSTRTLIGNVYLFDILNKASYDGTDFFFLEIRYPETDEHTTAHGHRQIYFWNGVTSLWEPLPSEDNPSVGAVRALIHLPYARLAVFEDGIMEYGKASWYAYKGCDCAASPDYPKGTELLVTSVADPAKSVVVVVNDFGPERDVFPDRVIDLDKVAFAQLAPLGAGVINVRVRPVQE